MNIPQESKEHSQYLKTLRWNEPCMYMREKIVEICTYNGHCRFKGHLAYDISIGKVPECKRSRVVKIMGLLDPKKKK